MQSYSKEDHVSCVLNGTCLQGLTHAVSDGVARTHSYAFNLVPHLSRSGELFDACVIIVHGWVHTVVVLNIIYTCYAVSICARVASIHVWNPRGAHHDYDRDQEWPPCHSVMKAAR